MLTHIFGQLAFPLCGKECKKFNCIVNYDIVQLFALLSGNEDEKWDIARGEGTFHICHEPFCEMKKSQEEIR